MILCQVCGNDIAHDLLVCPFCGGKQSPQPEAVAATGVFHKVVNLESGKPLVEHALRRLQMELEDVVRGNKAASKRVSKATLNFAKVAKIFRKESVEAGKIKT